MNREAETPYVPPVFAHMRELERAPRPAPGSATVLSNLDWGSDSAGATIRTLRTAGTGGGLGALRRDLARATALWRESRRPGVAALLEVDRAVLLFALLRSILPTRSAVLLFGFYLHPEPGWKRSMLRRALAGAGHCAVWSFRQRAAAARILDLPPETFVVLPYKANHSQNASGDDPPEGDYVFSGGNSERDYRTLFEAVRGTDIPVTVSATDPAVRRDLDPPDNVTLVRAVEPEFGRLMAGSRFVAIPLTAGRARGAGEASFLNAMWHGRAVLCADDVSAPEYIRHGVDGWVVPPGDPGALREAMLRLWRDRDLTRRLGEAGRTTVETWFTHERYRENLLLLARTLAAGGPLPAGG